MKYLFRKKMQNINIQVAFQFQFLYTFRKKNPICYYFCTSVRQASSAQSAYCKHTPCCLYVCRLYACVCVSEVNSRPMLTFPIGAQIVSVLNIVVQLMLDNLKLTHTHSHMERSLYCGGCGVRGKVGGGEFAMWGCVAIKKVCLLWFSSHPSFGIRATQQNVLLIKCV